jgi:hypothetical protein
MKPGALVRVVHHDPGGPFSEVPIWDAATLSPIGGVRHGEVFLVVRSGLTKSGLGLASAGWGGDAEIIHPTWGVILVEGAYLEAVYDSS